MFSLLGLILPGLFQTINGITNAIANEKIAQLKATTDQERIASQERINTLEAKKAAMLADSQHSSLDTWMRVFISIGPASYLTKIFLWDKVLKLGSTDQVTPDQWQVVMAVCGFYLLYSGATAVARILKS
jgi:hypothetical protein